MNSHFQTYSNLSSPHSPSPDEIRYTTLPGHPGHIGVSGNGIGGNGGGINNSNCNGNNMVHHHNNNHHHHHQNGHEQQMQMDNEQPNFHHLNNNSSQIKYCSGCGGKIVERYYLHALDRYWHNSCLKCYSCGALLGDIGSSCYTREGMILCKSDYIRMFGKAACSACGQIIAANEFVMRTTLPVSSQSQQNQQQQSISSNQEQLPVLPSENQKHLQSGQIEHHVFHLKCFACSKCSSQLRPGDKYYILAGSLVCEQDWHKLLIKNTTTNPPVRKGKVGRPRRSRD